MTEHAPQHHFYQPDEIEAMLAVATTGEPGASTTNPALDLSHLTPHEIVGAVHVVKEASSRVPISNYDERIPTEQDKRLHGYQSDIDSAFEKLPKLVGLEKARDVFTMLADSASPLDRSYAASFVGGLAEADHDYGLELWRRLLLDDDSTVAQNAWHAASFFAFISGRDDGAGGTERSLAEDGLTWADMIDLTELYVRRLQRLRNGDTSTDDLLDS